MNDMVIKSNQLITASYYLSLNEIRLLDLALAELSDYEEGEKELTLMPDFVHVTAETYARVYNVSLDMAYVALKTASKQLFHRYFTYEAPSELYPSHKEIHHARWVHQISYIKDKGVVTLSFTKLLIKLAGKLKCSFSRYHLEQKAPLTSIYAHRLYEMMMQWRNTQNVPTISYVELRQRFEIADDEYTRVSNFKARVLDPAIKQINDLTDIKISYEQEKEGRHIVGFTFKFKYKQAKKKKEVSDDIKAKNGDLFTIEGLSDKQLGRITRSPLFQQDYASRVAPNSIQNQNMEAWTAHFVQELKKDATRFNKRPMKDYLNY